MRSPCPLLFLLAALPLATSCSSVPPARPVEVTLTYAGPGADAPRVLEARVGSIAAPGRSQLVNVGRATGAPGPIQIAAPGESERDAKQAHHLARIAQWIVQRELGIHHGLGLAIIIFPLPAPHACRVTTELSPDLGLALGVPSIDGSIPGEQATTFLFGAVHRCVKLYLTNPEFAGASLTRRSPENLWIEEGLAGITGLRALAAALKEKDAEDLAPVSYVKPLDDALKKGVPDVRLAGWAPEESDAPPREEAILRHAAAMYLCHRWYVAAQRRGVAKPIASLLEHLRGSRLGPTYAEVTDWMRRVSALDVALEARSLPLEEVRKYHEAAWRTMGWKPGEAK